MIVVTAEDGGVRSGRGGWLTPYRRLSFERRRDGGENVGGDKMEGRARSFVGRARVCRVLITCTAVARMRIESRRFLVPERCESFDPCTADSLNGAHFIVWRLGSQDNCRNHHNQTVILPRNVD